MPLWRIYANSDTFSPEQKRGLAKDITELYHKEYPYLPAFYVNVIFVPLREEDVWVAGEQRKHFVRFVIEHIARTFPEAGKERKLRTKEFLDRINQKLKPYITDRPELTWESHINETPWDLWRVNGIDPPAPRSEHEKRWNETNEPTPWQPVSNL